MLQNVAYRPTVYRTGAKTILDQLFWVGTNYLSFAYRPMSEKLGPTGGQGTIYLGNIDHLTVSRPDSINKLLVTD